MLSWFISQALTIIHILRLNFCCQHWLWFSNCRLIPPEKRLCIFQDERDYIRLHKNYTQANCFMECRLAYAQKMLIEKDGKNYTCTPWFFPFKDGESQMCSPSDTAKVLLRMLEDIPEEECDQCLPDCSRVSYSYLVSAQPFRGCDEKNFGISDFCSFTPLMDKAPLIWTDQVTYSFGSAATWYQSSI